MRSFGSNLCLVKMLKFSKPQQRYNGKSDMPRAVSSYF